MAGGRTAYPEFGFSAGGRGADLGLAMGMVGRVFLVLTGACQFCHGVGGFTTNFIHFMGLTAPERRDFFWYHSIFLLEWELFFLFSTREV